MGFNRCKRRARYVMAVLALVMFENAMVEADEPSASDRETARQLMKEGDERFRAGSHATALEAYRGAHALMNAPTTGIAVARALRELGRLVEARDMALQVARIPVESGEHAVFEKARQEAKHMALELRERIPTLQVGLTGFSLSEVRVEVDGVELPQAAAQLPRAVNPGRHVVTAHGPGLKKVQQEVTLGEGQRLVVGIEMLPADGFSGKGSEPSVRVGTGEFVPMHVRVFCGPFMSSRLGGETDGLKVWVDGVLTPGKDVRATNTMTPGVLGALQFVSYDVKPGKRHIRIEADGCESSEQVIDVEPGAQRTVTGRLRPTTWYLRPPAASSGVGVALNYNLLKFDHIKVDDRQLQEVKLSPDTLSGYGIEVPVSMSFFWASAGFNWMKGNLPIEAPGNCPSYAQDCLPEGTLVNGTAKSWNISVLAAGRLPFAYGAVMLGTGLGVYAVTGDKAEADNSLMDILNMGYYLPLWAGVEVRPFCNLSVGARATRGFTTMKTPYQGATFSLAYHFTEGCRDTDFGIR